MMRRVNSQYFVFLVISIILICLVNPVWAEEGDSFIYDDHGKRDPLWELVSPSGTINNYETEFIISDLSLEGIISDPGDNDIAMINGQIVVVGDTIGQYAVTEISETSVTLTKGSQTYKLQLQRGE